MAISDVGGKQLPIRPLGTGFPEASTVFRTTTKAAPAICRQKGSMTDMTLINGVSDRNLPFLARLNGIQRFRHKQLRDVQGINPRQAKPAQPPHKSDASAKSLLQLLDLTGGGPGCR